MLLNYNSSLVSNAYHNRVDSCARDSLNAVVDGQLKTDMADITCGISFWL